MGRPPGNRTHCIKCGMDLDLDPVYNGSKRNSRCRNCYNEQQREWRDSNKDKARSIYLKYQYGISLEEYETLMKLQDGKCAICGLEDSRNLSVDHNHKTNQVRGLLCQKCNAMLGMIDENIELLESAINYLVKYKDIKV